MHGHGLRYSQLSLIVIFNRDSHVNRDFFVKGQPQVTCGSEWFIVSFLGPPLHGFGNRDFS